MKKQIVILGCLITSLAFASVENKEFDAKGVKTLNVKNSSGIVKVSVSGDGKAYVTAESANLGNNCTLKTERSGTELIVEVSRKSLFNTDDCKVNIDIKVPREIALRLKNGSGDLEVAGTKGLVDFTLGSGNAKINADVEHLEGKSGTGSIEVTGLSGTADVKTGSGNITLTYRSAPTKGALDIKTGSGDATIYLPPSMKVLTDFAAGNGRIYNELGDSAEAAFKVSMKAGSGNLRIKKL